MIQELYKKKRIIPTKYFEKTNEELKSVDSSNLKIQYKLSNVCIENQNVFYKTSFLLVKDLMTDIILRTPFISLLKPFTVTDEGIITKTIRRKSFSNSYLNQKKKLLIF